MKCHHCKKNLTDCEIFLKLDHYFCSDKCRNEFKYSLKVPINKLKPLLASELK